MLAARCYHVDLVNLLEITALKAFNWTIVMSPGTWGKWMRHIEIYHLAQPLNSEYGRVAHVINKVVSSDPHWDCECSLIGAPSDFQPFQPITPYISQPTLGHGVSIWGDCICPTGTDLFLPTIPQPSPWCPAADPIVENSKPRRTFGIAPSANSVAGRLPPRFEALRRSNQQYRLPF